MATIKFIDLDFIKAEVTLMVGIEFVTVKAHSYQSIKECISRAGGTIRKGPFIGYIKDLDKYDRYSRNFAKVALSLLNSQRV